MWIFNEQYGFCFDGVIKSCSDVVRVCAFFIHLLHAYGMIVHLFIRPILMDRTDVSLLMCA